MSNVLERLVPSEVSDAALVDHYARYLFAAQFTRPGCSVLDVACGVGYGSAMLANLGKCKVTGADVSNEAITHARRNYAQDNLTFVQDPIEALPSTLTEKFDLIASFETIEHVDNPKNALESLASLLKPDGIAVISIPNDIGLGVVNEYHLHRFTLNDFMDLVSGAFASSRFGRQNYGLSSSVWFEAPPELPAIGGTAHLHEQDSIRTALYNPGAAKENPAAFVAVAAHDPGILEKLVLKNVGTDSLAAWVDERRSQKAFENDNARRIAQLENELERLWKEYNRYSGGYEELRATLANKQEAENQYQERLKLASAEISRLETQLQDDRTRLRESEAQLQLCQDRLQSRKDALKRLLAGGNK